MYMWDVDERDLPWGYTPQVVLHLGFYVYFLVPHWPGNHRLGHTGWSKALRCHLSALC